MKLDIDLKEPDDLKAYLDETYYSPMMCLENGDKLPNMYEYVTTLEMRYKKIIERVWAIKVFRGKVYYQEVLRREGYRIFARNIYLAGMGGYKAVWSKKTNISPWYWNDADFNEWIEYKNGFNLYTRIITSVPEFLKDTKYKYTGLTNQNVSTSLISKLNMYDMHPELEVLWKIGITNDSFMLCNQIKKDKKIISYLIKFKDYIKSHYIPVRTILKAYKEKLPLDKYIETSKAKDKAKSIILAYKTLDLNESKLVKFFIKNNNVGIYEYKDFIDAVIYLKLDTNLEKNYVPHDFRYWHDYYTSQVKIIKSKKIDDELKKVAIKYKKLCKKTGDYILMIPSNSDEFVNEGEALHHCVGRMGYNQKMADGKCIIFFVREKGEPDKPLYTMEFDQMNKKIVQFYGDHDSVVPENVRNLFQTKWIDSVKRMMPTLA